MFKKLIFALFVIFTARPIADAAGLPLNLINLPEGFSIDLYANNIPYARQMAISPEGVLYVGTRKGGGEVYAVYDEDKDFKADRVEIIVKGLNSPNGVAFRENDLYVGEIHRIIKFENIDAQKSPYQYSVVNDSLPKENWHGWKYIRFGPDGKLYVPIGAPCNVCERKDMRFATISRMNPDGTGFEIFAQGIRNSVGYDWHPGTDELWFTDNGRDMMGDDIPPDELNHAPQPGMHFGFPYCHGAGIADPEFGKKYACSNFNPAKQPLGPHVASLGMKFYQGDMFPEQYHHQVFIAEHGSWNRSTKIGYRIRLVRLEGSEPVSYEDFSTGWLQGENVWGRPVDILVMPDGSMLVSDDYAGAIYRISYAQDRFRSVDMN